MSLQLLIALGMLGLTVLAILFVRMNKRDTEAAVVDDDPAPRLSAPAPRVSSPAPQPAAADPFEKVRAAMREGNKLMAIKEYRALTGTGLAVAKAAVEAMERGESPPAPSAAPPPVAAASMEEVKRLANAGQLIMAIKLHRELTGLGLAESKREVERIRDGR